MEEVKTDLTPPFKQACKKELILKISDFYPENSTLAYPVVYNEESGDWSDQSIQTASSKEAKSPNFRILAPKLEKLARKNEKNNKA